MEISALWAFEEDIQSRSWLDWLKAHTSFLQPLHRYEGHLTVYADNLHFSGIDKRTKEEVTFDIYKYQLLQLYLGFDKTFNLSETRGLGFWLPLRITFLQEEKEEKLYLITNYNLGFSDNKNCFEFLKIWAGNK
jgi:hypothetical protein